MNSNQEYKDVAEAVKNMTIEVNSFQEVDIRGLQVPIVCIYNSPEDYPDKVVARLFDLENPLNIVLVRYSIEEIREDIMKSFPHMVRFDRNKNDLKSITESWI